MRNADRDYLSLLYDIGELSNLIRESTDIQNLLDRTVAMISERLRAEVCSIYLYDEETRELVLRATRGLNPEAVEKVRMAYGTGLVGATLEGLEPIVEGDAPSHPRFKYFSEAHEDAFRSFLSVPLRQGEVQIGVLVVQHSSRDYFDDTDARALRAIASQLTGVLQNVRLLMDLRRRDGALERPAGENLSFVKGQAASPGFAYGPAVVFDRSHVRLLETGDLFSGTEDDFHRAVAETARQLEQLQQKITNRLPESASLIFSSHFLMLKDAQFTDRIVSKIRAGIVASEAIRETARHYIHLFGMSPHLYLQEKAKDIEDLAGRLLRNLAGHPWEDPDLYEHKVVIAPALYPSEVLKFAAEGAAGIVLTSGGVTSHVTILARSLQIPLIIAEESGLLNLPGNTVILMDGDLGNIYINPDKKTVKLFETKAGAETQSRSVSMENTTWTKDKERVVLMANINLLSEVPLARTLKAEGIGLYRTEFPFLIRATFPSEAEQYIIYKKLFDEMAPLPVMIRTLDAGGEKALAYSDSPKEANPELGLRSIRFSLKHRDIFEFQIRAMLRAAAGKKEIRIIFPLISSIDEFLEAKQVVYACMEALSREELEFNRDVALGMMVELPSVLATIDEFAKEADFFSIGTNDFIQYLLAADRSNKMVADHYIPCHPAVNRGIAKIAEAAMAHHIEVSVCGEMAHEKDYIPFLLGVGIRTLSVDPQFLPMVQKTVMGLDMAEAGQYARSVLEAFKNTPARKNG